ASRFSASDAHCLGGPVLSTVPRLGRNSLPLATVLFGVQSVSALVKKPAHASGAGFFYVFVDNKEGFLWSQLCQNCCPVST
ncbi:MAG: hypothetical protein WC810_17995, partial [Janthinobacterium sp.]